MISEVDTVDTVGAVVLELRVKEVLDTVGSVGVGGMVMTEMKNHKEVSIYLVLGEKLFNEKYQRVSIELFD